MSTLPDYDRAITFAVPTVGGGPARQGMLVEGPQGWGEFGPAGDDDRELARWLTAATEPGTVGWPDPVRGRVAVALTIADVDPTSAHAAAAAYPGPTVDVAGSPSLAADVAVVEAVRQAIGPTRTLRCTVSAPLDPDAAVTRVDALQRAAGGLEFVELSGCSAAVTAEVRRRVDVPIAVDAASVTAGSPSSLGEVADVIVLRTGPLGGVRRALRIAESCELPCVVGSSGESSVGLAGGVALAGALPDLPFACGLGTVGLLAGDLVSDVRSLVPVDGYLPVASMPPGPDPQRLQRFTSGAADVVSRWRNCLERARRLIGGTSALWGRGGADAGRRGSRIPSCGIAGDHRSATVSYLIGLASAGNWKSGSSRCHSGGGSSCQRRAGSPEVAVEEKTSYP